MLILRRRYRPREKVVGELAKRWGIVCTYEAASTLNSTSPLPLLRLQYSLRTPPQFKAVFELRCEIMDGSLETRTQTVNFLPSSFLADTWRSADIVNFLFAVSRALLVATIFCLVDSVVVDGSFQVSKIFGRKF